MTTTSETTTSVAEQKLQHKQQHELQRQHNPLLTLSYLVILGLWAASQVILIPYVIHLLLLVTAILYVACHGSLVLREETMDDAGNITASSQGETLRKQDAMQFPILGSASLLSLYLAFKFLDRELVNLLIGGYFGAVGCMALTATLAPFIPAVPKKTFSWSREMALVGKLHLEFTAADVIAFLASLVFCYFYMTTKHWALNNVLGICFCLQGIERFSLGTYKIGAILLVGLFFYDIFWVFGTDVMVTVAKNLDGPIKILFPRTLERNLETGKLDLSLLGLGDIVIPGFFLALLLRFDAHKANVPTFHSHIHADFAKPYFHSALAAYFLGLAMTLFIMIQFNAAQPALLYLVPACLGSSLICAMVRGELKELFAYSEEEEEEDESVDKDAEPVVAKDEEAKKVD